MFHRMSYYCQALYETVSYIFKKLLHVYVVCVCMCVPQQLSTTVILVLKQVVLLIK